MANDFTVDANCVALYRFESGALGDDSVGNNDLTAQNTPVVDTGDYQEGSGSVDLEKANSQYLSLADASLDSDYPFKSGDSTKKFSICFWFKPESVGAFVMYGLYTTTPTARKLQVATYNVDGFGIRMVFGYNNGANYEDIDFTPKLTAGQWYHAGFTFDGINKTASLRLHNGTSATTYSPDGTITNTIDTTPAPPLTIGGRGEGSFTFDGKMDEMAVFKDILSDSDVDEMRVQVYGSTPVLSSPTGSSTGSTTADGGVSTTHSSGTLYAAVTTSVTPPSVADIKAGTGAAYYTNQTVTTFGTQAVGATGLSSSTTYYWHFVNTDQFSQDSTIATSASFTTASSTVKGVTVTLYDKSSQTAQTSITGITARYWDSPTATGAPLSVSNIESTDANGVLEIDIDSVTSLGVGSYGYLSLYKAGAGYQTDLHFASRIEVEDIS